MKLQTVTQTLYDAADADQCGITFLDDETRLGYREIVARSLRVAALLRSRGVAVGDHLPMILGTGPAFLTTFYGAMFAGAIPVPISPPMGFGSLEAFAERVMAISRYVDARHAAVAVDLVTGLSSIMPHVEMIDEVTINAAPADDGFLPHVPGLDDVAFLQCTSGSTGAPKGAMLTHRNLSVNTGQMAHALHLDRTSSLVSWLPLNHDMGLIAAVLTPLFTGYDTAIMSPSRFMRRPASWLKAISDLKATISPAPNFGYSYALARIKDEELEGVDLSSWTHAMCGAEPIDCGKLLRFADRFGRWGLPPNAVQSAYGLAEATVGVAFHPIRGHDTIDRERFAAGEALDAPSGATSVDIAICGRPVIHSQARIVDEHRNVLPDGHIGRLELAGPQVMKGYYKMPEETAAKLRDGWLDTGDLAYIRDGAIRITGRTQDVIIIRGKKYHPTDFERAAELIQGVRCSVGFGVPSEEHARDLLYVVCEAEFPENEVDELRSRISDTVAQRTGLRPDHVLVTRTKRAIPKTTSGKVQRQKVKEAVLANRADSPWKAA